MAASATRLRCDPTEYARRQQEKKDRAKELKEQRTKGVFSDDHTFAPKVNPRAKGAPSSREEDERPTGGTMQRGSGSQYDDIPIRPSKTLQGATRKETQSPDEAPGRANRRPTGNSNRPNNNDDHAYVGDQDSDSLDTLSRKFPKKAAARQPEDAGEYSPPSKLQPEHDSLYREVKRTTGHDLEDIPISRLNAANKATKHTGPCLRNSSCGCPQCSGGGGGATSTSVRSDPPVRRRESASKQPEYDSQASYSSRSNYGSSQQSEMESSLTLLKSKMSRMKARTAPSNQASLYDGRPMVEPASKSARLPTSTSGYASSSTSTNRRMAPQEQQQPSPPPEQVAKSRSSMAQRKPPQQAQRYDEDDARQAPAGNRRLPRHEEDDEEETYGARAPPPISNGFSKGGEPDEYTDDTGEMAECGNCHRRFNVVSFAKHKKICEKVFSGPRKVFDMAAKRLEGTEAEKLLKQAGKKGKKGAASASSSNEDKPIKAKAADWKQQSNAFRDAMRANREINKAIKEGRPPPAMVPSAPDPSLIPCDYCGRRFNEKAAERHIPFCKEKAQRDVGGRGAGAKKTGAAAPPPAVKASAATTRAPPPRKK